MKQISISLRRVFLFSSYGLLVPAVQAAVVPAPVFGDYTVVQRGMPLPVWGTADPGEMVKVSFAGQSHETKAGADGNWQVIFAPLKGGARGNMVFSATNTVEAKDVVAGEVWFCSGQSNMGKDVGTSANAAAEIAAADLPDIRQFQVPPKPATEPQDASFLKGATWKPASPETVGKFTAAGYYFAKEIHRKFDVPVGIINSSWGGTRIQPWMPPEVLKADLGYEKMLEGKKAEIAAWPARKIELDQQLKDWEQQSATAKAEGREPPVKPWIPRPPDEGNNMPGQLYNGMIHPLVRFPIRGALWYQGESNAGGGVGGAAEYTRLQMGMVEGWRKAWGIGDFPFYFVQLPNFIAADATGRSWAFFREGQEKSLALKNTGMAVAIDIGDSNDIHPANKQEVGRRLARLAFARTYRQAGMAGSGPVFAGSSVQGDAIHVRFNHAEGGLVAKDPQAVTGFEIAAADGNFQPASANLQGDGVTVRSPEIKVPAFVRYAWINDPQAGLSNKEGLPLAPFRTDTFGK